MILSYLYLFSLCLSREKGKSLSLFGLKNSNKLPLLAVFTFHKTEFHYALSNIEHSLIISIIFGVVLVITYIIIAVRIYLNKTLAKIIFTYINLILGCLF